MFIVLAAVLERGLSLFGGPETYILCDDLVELSARLDREVSVNRWLLLAGLVLSVAALVRQHDRFQPGIAHPRSTAQARYPPQQNASI
ncbi:hypothetical protein [Streptomyces melanosporofaciens]|uniref:hypothetical protein n=1 Tax=Streptomyces melanosporofaciens TaxID=67327 RepID=UPI000B83DF0C|nr:hypothetical protein [Streptomyces melanosporofaciens]